MNSQVYLDGVGLSTHIPQEYEAIYRAAMAVGSQPAAQRQNRRKREEDSDDEEYVLSIPRRPCQADVRATYLSFTKNGTKETPARPRS